MKRFSKIILILAGIFLILGIGFSVSGVAMGGMETGFHIGNVLGWGRWILDEEDWDEEHEHHSAKSQSLASNSEDGSRTWELSIPQDLEVKLCNEELVMEAYQGSTIKIQVTNDSRKRVTVRETGDKVKVSSGSKKIKDHGVVHIFYPESARFRKLDISIQAGEGVLNNSLFAKEAELTVGAGEIDLKDSLTAEKCEIEVGVGEASLKGVDAKKIQGECGVGTLKLSVAGEEKDYDYDMECGIGSIEIGSDEYGGFATERSIQNQGSRKMELECGMGEILVSFLG